MGKAMNYAKALQQIVSDFSNIRITMRSGVVYTISITAEKPQRASAQAPSDADTTTPQKYSDPTTTHPIETATVESHCTDDIPFVGAAKPRVTAATVPPPKYVPAPPVAYTGIIQPRKRGRPSKAEVAARAAAFGVGKRSSRSRAKKVVEEVVLEEAFTPQGKPPAEMASARVEVFDDAIAVMGEPDAVADGHVDVADEPEANAGVTAPSTSEPKAAPSEPEAATSEPKAATSEPKAAPSDDAPFDADEPDYAKALDKPQRRRGRPSRAEIEARKAAMASSANRTKAPEPQEAGTDDIDGDPAPPPTNDAAPAKGTDDDPFGGPDDASDDDEKPWPRPARGPVISDAVIRRTPPPMTLEAAPPEALAAVNGDIAVDIAKYPTPAAAIVEIAKRAKAIGMTDVDKVVSEVVNIFMAHPVGRNLNPKAVANAATVVVRQTIIRDL